MVYAILVAANGDHLRMPIAKESKSFMQQSFLHKVFNLKQNSSDTTFSCLCCFFCNVSRPDVFLSNSEKTQCENYFSTNLVKIH